MALRVNARSEPAAVLGSLFLLVTSEASAVPSASLSFCGSAALGLRFSVANPALPAYFFATSRSTASNTRSGAAVKRCFTRTVAVGWVLIVSLLAGSGLLRPAPRL